jgi:hypothetical protein
MKKLMILFVMAFLIAYHTQAQAQNKLPCPAIVLSGPKDHKVIAGDPLVVYMKPFAKAYKDYFTYYNWTVSAGTISDGQNTDTVDVDTQGIKQGEKITVMLNLLEMKPGCPNSASFTAQVISQKPKQKSKRKG